MTRRSGSFVLTSLLLFGLASGCEPTVTPEAQRRHESCQEQTVALSNQGRLAEARETGRSCLALAQQTFGKRSPDLGVAHFNLGVVLMESGELDEAERHLQASLKIDEHAWGPQSVDVGWDLAKIGEIEFLRGNYLAASLATTSPEPRFTRRDIARPPRPTSTAWTRLSVSTSSGHPAAPTRRVSACSTMGAIFASTIKRRRRGIDSRVLDGVQLIGVVEG